MGSAKVQYGDKVASERFRARTKDRAALGNVLRWMTEVATKLGEDPSTLTFRVSSSKEALKEDAARVAALEGGSDDEASET